MNRHATNKVDSEPRGTNGARKVLSIVPAREDAPTPASPTRHKALTDGSSDESVVVRRRPKGAHGVASLSLLLACLAVFAPRPTQAIESFLVGKTEYTFVQSDVGRDGTIYVLSERQGNAYMVRYDRNGAPLGRPVEITGDEPERFVYAMHKSDETEDRLFVLVDSGSSDEVLRCSLDGTYSGTSYTLPSSMDATDVTYSADADEVLAFGKDGDLYLYRLSSGLSLNKESYWSSSGDYDPRNITTDPTGQIYAGYTDDADLLVGKVDRTGSSLLAEASVDVGTISSDESMNAVEYVNGFVYAAGFFKYSRNLEYEYGLWQTEDVNDGLLVRLDTKLTHEHQAAVRGRNIFIEGISSDPEGNLYVVGKLDEGEATFLHGCEDVPAPNTDEEEQQTFDEFAVPGNAFFVAKLDKDLQWKWVLLPTETMPEKVKGLAIQWNEVNERVMLSGTIKGEVKLGTTTVGETDEWSGFLAVIDPDGTMADKVRLEVRAEANVTSDDDSAMQVHQDVEKMLSPVLPFQGQDVDLIKGSSVTATVPELLYFDNSDQIIRHPTDPDKKEPTEAQIKDKAKKRFESTGYAVESQPVQGDASTYEFEIEDDTILVFTWDAYYALEIGHNLDGVGGVLESEAAGDPDPTAKKHWILAQEIVIAQINGKVDDSYVDNLGRRFIPYGYWAGGASDPAFKSTGTGNIIAETLPIQIATSGGSAGGQATAKLVSEGRTNDGLVFTFIPATPLVLPAPGDPGNSKQVRYVDGGGTTDSATVDYTDPTLTITVNDGYTLASTVRQVVNAADDTTVPFSVEYAAGSDGTAAMHLHGTTPSRTLAGGDTSLEASVIVPEPPQFQIARNETWGDINVKFVAGNKARASYSSSDDTLTLSVVLGTTTVPELALLIEDITKEPFTITRDATYTGTIDVLPEDVTIPWDQDSVDVVFLAANAIEFRARDAGPGGNVYSVQYRTPGVATPSTEYVGTTLMVEVDSIETVAQIISRVGTGGAVTAVLPGNVDNTTTMGTVTTGTPWALSGGRDGVAASTAFAINHSGHSTLVVKGIESAQVSLVDGEEVPLSDVTVSMTDSPALTGDSAKVTYTGTDTIGLDINAGTTTVQTVIDAINEHQKAAQAFVAEATKSSDATGLVTPSEDKTVGGAFDAPDTVTYQSERTAGITFKTPGEAGVAIRFEEADAFDALYNTGSNTAIFSVVLDETTLDDIQNAASLFLDSEGEPVFTSVELIGEGDQVAFRDPDNINLQFSGGAGTRPAFLSFNPPGKDNELTFVSKEPGEDGNAYSIKLVEDDNVEEEEPQVSFDSVNGILTVKHSPDGATINDLKDAVESTAGLPIKVSLEGFYLFPTLEKRQQIAQFVMDRPATITYEWKTQYRVRMSTTSSKSEAHPYIEVQPPKGYQEDSVGSGEFWYDGGTHLKIGARFRGGKQELRGWNAGTGHMPLDGTMDDLTEATINGAEYRMLEIDSLSRGTSVQWDYGDRIFDQRITIGNPVDVSMIRDAQNLTSGDEYLSLTVYLDTQPEIVTVIDGPSGTTGENVQVWDDVADIFYPLRPSMYQIEWPTSDPEQVVISRVTCGYADAPVPGTLTYSINPEGDAVQLRYQVVSDTGGAKRKTFAVLKPTDPDVEISRLRVQFSDPGGDTNTAGADYEDDLLKVSLNHGITTGQTVVNAINALVGFPYEAHTDELVVLPIGERFPGQPKSWTHITNVVDGEADIAPVDLEPSDTDMFHFQNLGYTQSGAIIDGVDFTATRAGYSTLVFSATTDGGAASGDLTQEVLHVRTVRTKYWYDGMDETGTATVGTKVTSVYDTAGLGTGAVVHRLGRYNVYIHDRLGPNGPIFPVNQQFTGKRDHDLVVAWYENHLHEPQIDWPYQTVKYEVSWPDTTQSNGFNRIVIASMLGTEGKRWVSNLDLDAGVEPEEQVVYDPELFDELAVYVQDDPATGGYNPNEEHALLASSFKSRGEANPPTAAFALRSDLNITKADETYTSDCFTLVQYRDLVDDEMKMLVYRVEKQDTRDVYEFVIPNIDFVYDYMFKLPTRAGEIVLAPHPMDIVIGALPSRSTFGVDLNPNQKVYFEDHKGWPWSVSGDSDELNGIDDARFTAHFFYPLQPSFYYALDNDGDDQPQAAGQYVPWLPPKGTTEEDAPTTVLQSDLEPGLGVEVEVANVAGFKVGDYIGIADGGRSEYGLHVTKVSATARTLTIERLYTEKQAGAEVSLRHTPVPVTYISTWPDDIATLKVGETLTYSGGEFRADHPVSRNRYGDEFATPGLPGVVAWAAGELIFDSENPTLHRDLMGSDYSARLFPALSTRQVEMSTEDYERSPDLLPASGNIMVDEGRYYFKGLSASLQRRVFYDPLMQKLGVFGILNDKIIGDETLTAAPPAVYVLEPNVLTPGERDSILALSQDFKWQEKVDELYNLTRDPNNVSPGIGGNKWLVGLQRDENTTEVEQQQGLGVGLALVTNPALMKPTAAPGVRYVTLAENNHPDLGAAPVSLHIVRVVVADKDIPQNNPNGLAADHFRYRGALKTVLSNNVFDEKIIIRHTADFGGFADDLAFEWYYRGEDGTSALLPNMEPAKWLLFPTDDEGVGQYQISLEGTGPVIIRDNWFFMRYRHIDERFPENPAPPDDVAPYQWVGAGNSRPPDEELGELPEETYLPQLVMGWVKRVLDAINPYEARIKEFKSTESPATYVSMIQQFGQRYEGPVALNPEKNVIENVGLIELYTTVMERAKDLSIDLATPVTDGAVCNAIQLASTRIADFYMLLGNEAYADSLDPCIGFGSDSTEYGALAPSIFTFQNQLDTLLKEELALLRGTDEYHARPVYNRLFWNFVKGEGEAAYAMAYNVQDVTRDGFIDEYDAMVMYPQGHGDAWGHYLTAIKTQYDLLHHNFFNWQARSEFYNLMDIVLDVDFRDERKFAQIAAARARTGASIVDMTYRDRYVADPAGQWQGYTDTEENRAWGLEGWARRAGQGALFDWLTANALIPSEHPDPEADGIQRVDRSTVEDIDSIAAEFAAIDGKMDAANSGHNPLGLAPGSVPFDIDPTYTEVGSVEQGYMHFDQIYDRAERALRNARAAFDHANQLNNMLRHIANDADQFAYDVEEQDLGFRNRLIEIFGTPHEGMIGPGKIYPEGYNGPDLILYQYVDVREVTNDTVPEPSETMKKMFRKFAQGIPGMQGSNEGLGGMVGIEEVPHQTYTEVFWKKGSDGNWVWTKETKEYSDLHFENLYAPYFLSDAGISLSEVTNVEFVQNDRVFELDLPVCAKGYAFIPPEDWGVRACTGLIQEQIRELVIAEAELARTIAAYDNYVYDLKRSFSDLNQLATTANTHIDELEKLKMETDEVLDRALGMRVGAGIFNLTADITDYIVNAVSETIPKNFIAGLCAGGDVASSGRGAVILGGVIQFASKAIALGLEMGAIQEENDLELFRQDIDIDIQTAQYKREVMATFRQLASNMGVEPEARLDVFTKIEELTQASDRVRTTIKGGWRVVQEREMFNIKTAGVVQKHRYEDMTFRVFRNDALQKYKATFDLAARYAYLAAQAYDYETNLDPDHPASAQGILADIVAARNVGELSNGEAVVGPPGLADLLGRLRANFRVLRTRFGMNNPQYQTGMFSLRHELFRIRREQDLSGSGEIADANRRWREALAGYRVADLWDVPEFRRHCRPFAAKHAGAQPGLVIPMPTSIVAGENFFGKPAGPGDNAFNPTAYATKIIGVGLWLDDYDESAMVATPYVYLVPAGSDVMYIPDSNDLAVRVWHVVDQTIPVPFAIGEHELGNPDWIPVRDSLSEGIAKIRRHAAFRAYGNTTEYDKDAMVFDTRLTARSVWNTRWMLIIPGISFDANPDDGLDTFIYGKLKPGRVAGGDSENDRDLNGTKDIRLTLYTYSFGGM